MTAEPSPTKHKYAPAIVIAVVNDVNGQPSAGLLGTSPQSAVAHSTIASPMMSIVGREKPT